MEVNVKSMDKSLVQNVFIQKRNQFLIFLCVILVITIVTTMITEYDHLVGLISIPNAFLWMVKNFYPTSDSLSRLPNILSKLTDTVFMSITATTTAALLAFFFSLLGSKTTKVSNVLAHFSRLVASVFRNVPDVVWAMIFLFSFGQNSLTGYFALFFVTFGVLSRAFIETIDEVSSAGVEALRATGSGYYHIVFQAVLPSAIPQMISWVLYMIETNVRSATLIGILTGTGIGNLFLLYYRSFNYASASLVVVVIVLTVFVIESISNNLRRAIL